MGILNVTPDSFSDGGSNQTLALAVDNALAMQQAGATIIDIGGESTRPGAQAVALQEELDRVIPVVRALKASSDVIVSVDTSKTEVMKQALDAGADMINDVCALQDEGALALVAEREVPVCIMHMQGKPRTMQNNPTYQDVVADVLDWLANRVEQCVSAGIAREKIILDPGFGFGKTLEHNYQLIARLEEFHVLGLPILAGMSRKSMIGQVTGREVADRLAGSLALATHAAYKGAHILRVHDVAETVDAVKVTEKIIKYGIGK